MVSWSVDYSAFERAHRRLEETHSEWNTPEELEETLTLLAGFLRSPGVPRSGRALELGCGGGELAVWLAELGFAVFGVDISPTAIRRARERFAARGFEGDFRVASVLDLSEFDDGFFDLVLDGHCFHCIIGEDRRAFLANAWRVLRRGGIFHVATMCGEIHDPEVRDSFDAATRCLVRDGVAIRQINPAPDILREIEDAGFRVLRHEIDPPTKIHDQADLLVNATK